MKRKIFLGVLLLCVLVCSFYAVALADNEPPADLIVAAPLEAPVVTLQKVSGTSIKVSWKKITGAAGYEVWMDSSNDNADYTLVKDVTGGSTLTYTQTVAPSGTYSFKVRAYSMANGAQEKVYSADSSAKSLKLTFAAPNITLLKIYGSNISISWRKIDSATQYEVYVKAAGDTDYTLIDTITSGTSCVYAGMLGETYSFKVRAVSTIGGNTESGYSSVRNLKVPFSAPIVKVNKASATSISISWKKVNGATGYEIQMSTSKNSGYETIATADASQLNCVQTVLPDGTYYFKVRALCTVGDKTSYSSYSGVRSLKLKFSAPIVTVKKASSTSINVSWKKVEGAAGYEVYMSTSKNGSYDLVQTIENGSTLNALQEGLTAGTTYYFKVRAVCVVGTDTIKSAYSSVKSLKLPPIDPLSNATTGQKNALKRAKQYLNVIAFSYEGLIGQLEYEGFTHEEAVYGADHCGADWYVQVVKSAKQYLKVSAFSYTGLIGQLEYEEFTHDQAVYGADLCGADWYEQAAKMAKQYLRIFSFSRSELIEQLEYEGFTHAQAVYGAQQNGF